MPKPFSHLALMARMKAVLKRADMPQPVEGLPDFSIGELAIHFQNREVTVRGEPARLSPVEYRLLQILVRNAGHVVPHEVLLDRV